jgi:hypothetical protein
LSKFQDVYTLFILISYFLLALKESSKENAPKNPTEEFCDPQAYPNKDAKSFGSHIWLRRARRKESVIVMRD